MVLIRVWNYKVLVLTLAKYSYFDKADSLYGLLPMHFSLCLTLHLIRKHRFPFLKRLMKSFDQKCWMRTSSRIVSRDENRFGRCIVGQGLVSGRTFFGSIHHHVHSLEEFALECCQIHNLRDDGQERQRVLPRWITRAIITIQMQSRYMGWQPFSHPCSFLRLT